MTEPLWRSHFWSDHPTFEVVVSVGFVVAALLILWYDLRTNRKAS